MCDKCKNDTLCVEYSILTKHGMITLCPNCVAMSILNKTLTIDPGLYISEISGKPGAVRIDCQGTQYDLLPDEALRLLGHALMPNEYKALLKTHSEYEFEIHEDFYSDDGFAYQPYLEEEYVKDLTQYLNTIKLITEENRAMKTESFPFDHNNV